MPKRVDHDQRRTRIAEAVWRIAAERGLEGVSVRQVAAGAGVSVGTVQHYFADKDEMVEFAAVSLREGLDERLRRAVAGAPPPRTPLRLLRAMLPALLPLDPAGRTGALVGIAVFFRALHQPGIAATYERGRALLLAAVTDRIRDAVGAGEVPAGADPGLEARVLLSTVGGLGYDLLLGHCSAEQAVQVLHHQIDRLAAGG